MDNNENDSSNVLHIHSPNDPFLRFYRHPWIYYKVMYRVSIIANIILLGLLLLKK